MHSLEVLQIFATGRRKVMTGELINEILAGIGLELLEEDTRQGNAGRDIPVSQK